MNKTGLIHIYCGDGKGKTTAGFGLCMRGAGFGYQVVIYQMMKNNNGRERKILESLDNVFFVKGLEEERFSFLLTEEEKEERRRFYMENFLEAIDLAKNKDILFLDEILYAIGAGMFPKEVLIQYLKEEKPEHLEVILTGQGLFDELMELGDYISEICKVKHPYDRGIGARDGIER